MKTDASENTYRQIVIMLFITVVLFIFSPLFSSAQVPVGLDPLIITASPKHPAPNQLVIVEVKSFSLNLERAEIGWVIDGKLRSQDIGLTSFTLATSAVGSKTTVTILIRTVEGSVLERTVVIRPAEVVLLWQADTYTPPLYRGKALPSAGSDVTIIALPNMIDKNGNKVRAGNALFSWRKDNLIVGSASGFGKNKFLVQAPQSGGSIPLTVEVSSSDGSVTATGRITVTSRETFPLFYEKHPLRGTLYGHVLKNNVELRNTEVTIVAEPYYFSKNILDQGVGTFQWSIDNGSVSPTGDFPNEITLRAQEGSVQSEIALDIRNIIQFLQFASNSFVLFTQ